MRVIPAFDPLEHGELGLRLRLEQPAIEQFLLQRCEEALGHCVVERVADVLVDKIVARASTIKLGDPKDPATEMGPVSNQPQYDKVLSHFASAREQGARIAYGGEPAEELGGFFVKPTVLTGVNPSMRAVREEIFGPVLSVIRFKTEDEAVALANASSYGLQASVWSHNVNRAHRVARALRAGTVHVNQYDEDDITVPFGGYKQSGNGRDKSLHAFDKYTELKTTWLRID